MGARVCGDSTAMCVGVLSVCLCPGSELFKKERETVKPGEDTGGKCSPHSLTFALLRAEFEPLTCLCRGREAAGAWSRESSGWTGTGFRC